ncbi:single-stranded DNA-binding protein [bacterium]|nr:MAG: single-stranded DNA-binding protein [bacterium]
MYQHITIVGRLGRDPEMRYTPNGQAVTSFSVATDRQWTDANGQKAKETTWFRISVWGKQAETTNQYLKKGSLVLVEGRLTPDPKTGGPRIWKKQDGSEGSSFEINATAVRFLSTRSETSGGGSEYSEEGPVVPAGGDEDIPF